MGEELKEREKKGNSKKMVERVIFLFIFFAILWLIPRYLMVRVIVDGPSMETTLLDKENVLMEKISIYTKNLKRFDIIVFHPNGQTDKNYIKRILGLPGETIQIVGETIYINQQPIEDPFGKSAMKTAGIAEKEIKLGSEEYFVLGDNRAISKDSRDKEVGVVKLSEIAGRVMLRIWPLNKFGKIDS